MHRFTGFGVWQGIKFRSQFAEILHFPAYQLGSYIFLKEGDVAFGAEQRVTAAGTGVLHGHAIAHGNLAVFKHQHNGYGFSSLAHRNKSRGFRFAFVHGAIGFGAVADGHLVVVKKSAFAL